MPNLFVESFSESEAHYSCDTFFLLDKYFLLYFSLIWQHLVAVKSKIVWQSTSCQRSCQFATMAAAMLSNKNLSKLIRHHIKFAKSLHSKTLYIVNKPPLNVTCQQCAAASHYRVKFCVEQTHIYFVTFLVVLKGFLWRNGVQCLTYLL